MQIVETQLTQLQATIAALESQRSLLGETVVNAALIPLKQQLTELEQATTSKAAIEGERKLVTIMFADIAGFTALSEQLDPEQVRSLMNDCFDALVPAIKKYDGTIDKFIGDAILALFGAPIAYENHAERALRAALEMMDALHQFNARHNIKLGLHFGINTGLVIAGGIGSEGQQQYSVMGDAVNLAARLEDASETGQILVGQNTYRLTSPLFAFDPLAPIKVKGKAEPVAVYSLIGLKSSPGTMRGIEGLRTPLVGRDTEMRRLKTYFSDLEQGKGQIVSVIGEAGLGKSRLITEAARTYQPAATWVEGRCLSYAENISYHVASDILYTLIGADNEMPASEVATALSGSVTRLFQDQVVEIHPYLARLLNVPLDVAYTEKIKYLGAEALRSRLLNAYAAYIRARAAEIPLILVWEDVHWSDPSSLAVLEKLLPLAQEVPLLLLIVFRPEIGLATEFYQKHLAGFLTLEVQPLSEEMSIQLLNHLVRVSHLPHTVFQMILQKAEGNAFFLEEVLRSLIDAGLIIVHENGAVASPEIQKLKAIDIPDTLQGVIAARIDRLPPEHKQTLQTAAVIGRVFQEQVLATLFEQEALSITLPATLRRLREREFIRLKSEMEYIFKHAVTQDVAYSSLLIARRKTLHKVTAEAIEKLFPQNLDELSATLAYHYQHAEIPDKAITYIIKAADRAKGTYANTEAIRFYRSAIELTCGAEHIASDLLEQIYENLGDVLKLVGKHEEARSTYQEAAKLTSPADMILKARLQRKTAITWEVQRCADDALLAYQQAEEALGEAQTSEIWWQEWLEIQTDKTRLYYWLKRVDAIEAMIQKIEPVINVYGNSTQRGNFFITQAIAALQRERYVPSVEPLQYAQIAAEAVRDSSNLPLVAWVNFGLGFILLWRNALSEAEEQLKKTLHLTEQTGDITTQSRTLSYLTIIQRKRGDVTQVRRLAEQSLQCSQTGQMIEYIGMAYANLAWADWREGNLALSLENGQRAFNYLQQVMQGSMIPWVVCCPLVAVSLAQHQLEDAIRYAKLMTEGIQPLTEIISPFIENALQAWERRDREATQQFLEEAMAAGQSIGYF